MTSRRPLAVLTAIGVAAVGSVAMMLAAPAQAEAAQATPCSAAANACVDLSTQQAWLIRNGVVVYGPVKVRTGRSSAPTNPGTFHVTFKDKRHVSSIFHVAMPYSVFFNGGDAFHLGSLAVSSHGCVHLSRKAAVTFFNDLHVGDEVQVVR
ncbi:MAG TPA: L,D-transpeptidase [Pseudonocardiaceae bacterium]|nr:L,D-transpeptidase [Pseudonocardiaceae bacterium]